MSYWQGGQDAGGQSGAYWNANSGGGGAGGGFGANGGEWKRGGGGGGGGGGFGGGNSYGGDRNQSMEIEIERAFVGRVIGRGGSKIRELENDTGARIKVYSDRSNGMMTPIELIGSEDSQMHAKQLIEELCVQDYSQGGRQPYGGGGGGGGAAAVQFDDSGPPLEIDIDCKDVGRIIGRGGSKIRELQDKSGARIQIYKDRSNGVTTPIELRGSDSAKMKAKSMIEALCEAMQQY